MEDCIVDFELTHENKGFESIQYVVNSQGEAQAAGRGVQGRHAAAAWLLCAPAPAGTAQGCCMCGRVRGCSEPAAQPVLRPSSPPAGAWLLGLCEGNHCMGGSEGRDPGQGRIVASQLERDAEGECV